MYQSHIGRLAGLAALLFFAVGCSLNAGTDVGPMDLRTIDRATSPNDALACPMGTCKAEGDLESPVFRVTREKLMIHAKQVIAGQSRIKLIASDAQLDQLVYVQRSKFLGFPDTIWIQGVTVGAGSSVIIYSRSNYGYSDFGVNRDRVNVWLDDIQRSIAALSQVP